MSRKGDGAKILLPEKNGMKPILENWNAVDWNENVVEGPHRGIHNLNNSKTEVQNIRMSVLLKI